MMEMMHIWYTARFVRRQFRHAETACFNILFSVHRCVQILGMR